MTVITLHEAEVEFYESVVHYEAKEAGLGIRFRDEVAAVIDWISHNPEVPRLRRKLYRRVNLRVFSHYVAYTSGKTQFGSLLLLMLTAGQSFGWEESNG